MIGKTNSERSFRITESLDIYINGVLKISYDGTISKTLDITLMSLDAAPANHTHSKTEIVDFPTSLLANGGNSDTVNGVAFNWAYKASEQPTWVYGCNGSPNMYLYDPSDFNVHRADYIGDYHWDDIVPKTVWLGDNADANNVTTSGFYRFHAKPINVQNFAYSQMLVMRGSDTMSQLVFDYGGQSIIYRSGNPTNIGGVGSLQNWRYIATSAIANYSLTDISSTSPQGEMLWAF